MGVRAAILPLSSTLHLVRTTHGDLKPPSHGRSQFLLRFTGVFWCEFLLSEAGDGGGHQRAGPHSVSGIVVGGGQHH